MHALNTSKPVPIPQGSFHYYQGKWTLEWSLTLNSGQKVHAGVLKDNTRVVIKVQHLGMEKVMASDLRNIGWVCPPDLIIN